MAQKKILIDVNIGVLNPIGSNKLRTFYSKINPLSIEYYSRKKLNNPSFSILGDIAYPLTERLSIGIQSGLYLRIKEEYTTTAQLTSIFIPLQLTGKYNLFKISNKYLGINLAAGLLFFDFTDAVERYHNSASYNASLSYPLSKKGFIRVGIEEQFDNVSYDIMKEFSFVKDEKFDYKQKRLFVYLSYSIKIK
jgi:hypothetical protein